MLKPLVGLRSLVLERHHCTSLGLSSSGLAAIAELHGLRSLTFSADHTVHFGSLAILSGLHSLSSLSASRVQGPASIRSLAGLDVRPIIMTHHFQRRV